MNDLVPVAPQPAPLGPSRKLSTEDAAGLVAAFWKGLAPVTRLGYRNDLRHFCAFLEPGGWTQGLFDKARTAEERDATLERGLSRAIRHLVSIGLGASNALALRWRVFMQEEKKLAPATVSRRLAALKKLVSLARRLGFIEWRLELDKIEKEGRRDMDGPSNDEVDLILEAAEKQEGPIGRRDAALIRLLSDRGLRRNEAVTLDVGHVAEEGVMVLAKQRREREHVDLAAVTLAAIEAWLEVHPRGKDPKAPLFIGLMGPRAGHRLSGRQVANLVEDLARRAGIEKKVRPHGFRHTSITRALDLSDGDIRKAQAFSRHKTLDMLLVYDNKRRALAKEMTDLVAKPLPKSDPVEPLKSRPDSPRVEPLKSRPDSPRVEPLKSETPKKGSKKIPRGPKGHDLPW